MVLFCVQFSGVRDVCFVDVGDHHCVNFLSKLNEERKKKSKVGTKNLGNSGFLNHEYLVTV